MTYLFTICLLILVTPAMALDYAVRVIRTPVIPCDGQNISGRNNDSFNLETNQQTRIYRATVILDNMAPNQTGRIDISQDFWDVSGQFPIISMFDGERTKTEIFSPDAILIPAAQALAWEATCAGEGTRTYRIAIFYAGAG